MELIAYIGPMWSGKTEALKAFAESSIANELNVGIFDHPQNNRNSARDLSCNFPNTQKFSPDEVLSAKLDVLIFDEVHLYDCFGTAELFLSTIKKATAKVAVLAGIYYDFYNDYRPFPIWNKLTLLRCEFRDTNPVTPCHICGTWHGVRYTASLGEPGQRVGDFYCNVCRPCGIQYQREWRAKHCELVKV